ncbi:RNA polymerase sigma factor [Negadavirga shengliensis]|uniref:RNA polymerase sigma factor n=1 Tax=Negadavirga shengliensis TaxID=1389218 RepID=A0ABV9T681_9BACT
MIKTNCSDIPALVLALKNGDEHAFSLLFGIFGPKVYATCRKMSLTHEDAEEIVQEVFLKIWNGRANLDNTLSFNAYLLTIMRSLAFKKAKKHALQVAYQKYAVVYGQRTCNNSEEELHYKDLKFFSERAISSLPKGQQEVFNLKYIQQLSSDEIASKLCISKRTVENQIYKATKSLKQKFLLNEAIPSDLVILVMIYLAS